MTDQEQTPDQEQVFDQFKEQVLKDGPRLGLDDTFRFGCHNKLDCFNHCCHDVNILLTPYDIIRMKNRVGMKSEDFLDRYCVIPFSENLKYPIVMLKMSDDDELSCPFLKTPDGCSIYEDRPWSCRMYPLGRAAPPKQDTREETFYFLVSEEFCKGHETDKEWTVAQWLDNQGVSDYDQMGGFFQEIAQHERLQGAEDLSVEALDMLFMVCYDIDKFRRFVFGTKFLQTFEVAEETVEEIRTDDIALMKLGFDWVRFALWQEKTLKIREEIVEAKKAETGTNNDEQ